MEKTLGLALSGGGLRGAAHIGFLKYLEEKGVKPSVIGGTSAGAIVGALYAAGNSPETVLQVFKKTKIFSFSYLSWFKPGLLDTDAFEQSLRPMIPNDDFESLDIELFLTATNLLDGCLDVFHSGPVVKVILASAAFPGIFAPVQIGDKLYGDGGIFNNLPANVIRDHCDVVVGINVYPVGQVKKESLNNTFNVVRRVLDLTIYDQATQYQDFCDCYILPSDLCKYQMFSSANLDDIFEIGYREGEQYFGKIKKLLDH